MTCDVTMLQLLPCDGPDGIYLHALAADFSVGVNNVVGSETHKKETREKH